MSICEVHINQIRNNKIRIRIETTRSTEREFDIIVDVGGLRITTENMLVVYPKSTNMVRIDQIN